MLNRLLCFLALLYTVVDQLTTVVGGFACFLCAGLQVLNDLNDIASGLLGFTCQRTYFVGDYRKATALFASARGFNRCVQCE
ncbi:Uncharacterised protein [Vibrio cholerae]|nr:Uncharacterised protein [Vibrio cholerae]